MSRTRLLAFGTTALSNGNFCSFSFGPFSGTLRLRTIYLDCGGSAQQNGAVGIFTSPGNDQPSGIVANPAPLPAGWTPIYTHSLFDGGSVVDGELYKFPFGTKSDAGPIIMTGLDLDLVGSLFFLKVWVNNRTAAAYDPQGWLAVEENPPGTEGLPIEPRVPPLEEAAPPPPPLTEAAAAAPPPEAAPPPPPPPAALLPIASAESIPPVQIDPQDPVESSRELCQ